jgi:hypothetical protein
VRGALTATAVAIAVLFAALPTPATAKPPTSRQISRAIAKAERSSSLWATVNICASNGKNKGGNIGIRGQMPALGFSSTMRMTVQLGAWSTKSKRFVPITGSTATSNLAVGSASTGLEQDGAEFGFRGHVGSLDATIEFSWSRGGRVLGGTSRTTSAGHRDADYGSPAHYSASSCRLG